MWKNESCASHRVCIFNGRNENPLKRQAVRIQNMSKCAIAGIHIPGRTEDRHFDIAAPFLLDLHNKLRRVGTRF